MTASAMAALIMRPAVRRTIRDTATRKARRAPGRKSSRPAGDAQPASCTARHRVRISQGARRLGCFARPACKSHEPPPRTQGDPGAARWHGVCYGAGRHDETRHPDTPPRFTPHGSGRRGGMRVQPAAAAGHGRTGAEPAGHRRRSPKRRPRPPKRRRRRSNARRRTSANPVVSRAPGPSGPATAGAVSSRRPSRRPRRRNNPPPRRPPRTAPTSRRRRSPKARRSKGRGANRGVLLVERFAPPGRFRVG